jgi:CubicO group peptidase (beta-lactamase class C family)
VLKEGLVVGDPEAEGIDASALTKLVAKAKAQHSEALVVLKNGKLVYEDYFGLADEPIVAMSASKSFTSLAFGFLVAEGKLASLDELVSKTLPGLASDPRKAKITYRHLLTQTSGIDPKRAGGSKGDIEAHALEVSCLFEPGTSWQYSNNGVDLLAALAGKLAGKPMDEYLNEKLFHPLGIADVDWKRDKKGVPLGAGEMRIRPLDMAKVGQAMLDRGKWRSAQVIPETWTQLSFAQSNTFEPLYGLLWWRSAPVTAIGLTDDLLAQWKTGGLDPAIAAKAQPLVGQKYPTWSKYQTAMTMLLTLDERNALDAVVKAGDHLTYVRDLELGAVTAYDAAGWLGQFLVVAPEKNLVAVRMRRARDSDYGSGPEVDGFSTFPSEVPAIAH